MNTILKTTRIAALCIAAPLCFSSAANAAEGEGWDWMVAPYVWAASIGTDLETRTPPSAASTDTDFGDIVDKIDGAFQIHAEGQGEQLGRVRRLHLPWPGRQQRSPALPYRIRPRYAAVRAGRGLEPGRGTFPRRGCVRRTALHRHGPDGAARSRRTRRSTDVSVDGGDTFNDFMLGARYTWALSDRWGLTLRGDGSFGDTEGTWNASAVAQLSDQARRLVLRLSLPRCRDRNRKRQYQHHHERADGRLRLQVLMCDRFDDSFKPEPGIGSA